MVYKKILFFIFLLFLSFQNLLHATNPDAVYPIPANYGTESAYGVNLFTGDINKAIPLITIEGNNVSYTLNAFYNSRTAALVTQGTSTTYISNSLGGLGWKLMDYPKIAQDGSSYYLLDGHLNYHLQSIGSSTYTPGGKYYLWKVIKKPENSWEIAVEDGIRYKFTGPPFVQEGSNVNIWNLSTKTAPIWGNKINFDYSFGTLTAVSNSSGNSYNFTYSGSNGRLQNIEQRINDNAVKTIELSYGTVTTSSGTNYSLLSNIKPKYQIGAGRTSKLSAGTDFEYLNYNSTPPLGGVNYPGALCRITMPEGGAFTYSYQTGSSTPGIAAPVYNVTQYAVNNGYNNNYRVVADPHTYTTFKYNATNITLGSDTVYIHYNEVSTAPGLKYSSHDPDTSHPYGNVEIYFLNGTSSAFLLDLPVGYGTAGVTNAALRGLAYRAIINSEGTVSDSKEFKAEYQHFWSVGYLPNGTVGAFPKLDMIYDERYGIGGTTTFNYGGDFNLPVEVTTTRRNPKPLDPVFNKDTLKTEITYAYQQYPALEEDDLYLINIPAKIVKSVQVDMQGPYVTTNCECTQWAQWNTDGLPGTSNGTWAAHKKIAMRSSSADPNNCFNAAGTGTSSNWLVKSSINLRAKDGMVIEETNEAETLTSSIYSGTSTGSKVIATFVNAKVPDVNDRAALNNANADYLGFESYEPDYNLRWSVSASISSEYSHTGKNSLTNGHLVRTFTPNDANNRFYVFSAWSKSIGSDTANFSLDDVTGGAGSSTTDQTSKWEYFDYSKLVLAGSSTTAHIFIPEDVFVDDVRFMPVDSTFEAKVYDMNLNNNIVTLGMNTDVTFHVFNRFNSLVATVGPGSVEQIKNISIPYNSRRGNMFINGINAFDFEYPNMTLNVGAQEGGVWEGFEHQTNNNFLPVDMSGMSVTEGWLTADTATATAQFSGTVDSNHFSLYTEIFPNQLASSEEVGVSMEMENLNVYGSVTGSTRLKFALTPTEVKLYDESAVYGSITANSALNGTSLFLEVVDQQTVFAYANGRYVFHYDFSFGKISGPVKLIANNMGAAFDNFMYVEDPYVSQTTFDGLKRPKQRMARKDADELHISETLYGGPLDLPVAQTRSATIGGDDTEDLGFSYKLDFADGFNYDTMEIGTSSVLRSAAAYDNPFSSSVRYSPSPLLRIAAVGGGGQFTVDEEGDHYTTFTYSENVGTIFDYTADELLVTTKTNPDDSVDYTYANRDKVVFARAKVKSSPTDTSTIKTQYEYDKSMRLAKVYQPNYFDDTVVNNENFISQYSYDFLGNRATVYTPDIGTQTSVYDSAGRVRFKIDANGQAADPNVVTYIKYDWLGRVTEQGLLQQPWNQAQFQQYADTNPAYPGTSTAHTWRKIFAYDGQGAADGPGSVPNQGKLTMATMNFDADNIPDVTENYEYDEYGNVLEKALLVADFGTTSASVQYTYNLQNRVTKIDFSGSATPSVVYTYDDQGRNTGIGAPDNPYFYAAYDYGYETIEYLNNRSFFRRYEYNNAGWPTKISDPLFSEDISYQHQHSGTTTFYYNGNVAQLTDQLKWDNSSITANFTYDADFRLSTVNYGTGNPWNIGSNIPLSYDDNGNIVNLQLGAYPAYIYQYYSGDNRLKTIEGFSEDFSYDNNGAITSVPYGVYDIKYDEVTGMTTSMTLGGTTTAFQYDWRNQRVLKSVTSPGSVTTNRMYVRGMNDYPLMELFRDSAGTKTATFYVYGPTGLIAIQQGGEALFVLKDHLGSVRAVMDDENSVMASFDYSAFGNTVYSSIDQSIAHIPLNYRYTGQEVELELGGVYNYRARFYDPGWRRFYSPDPLMQFPSPYEYVGDNPVKYVDPSGEEEWVSIPAATTLPPINAQDNGISKPERVDASDFGVTGRKVQGWYSIVDLTKAQVVVPNNKEDNKKNGNIICPNSQCGVCKFPYRVIFKAEAGKEQIDNCGVDTVDQTTKNTNTWEYFYSEPILWINANFFDISTPGTHPYSNYCTNILGVSFSNGDSISDWLNYPAWEDRYGYIKYDLDALIFYKPNAPQGNGKKAEIVLYNDFSHNNYLADNAQNAVGGIYFFRNGTFSAQLFHGVVDSSYPNGRTAIGISDDALKLLVLEVDNNIPNSDGVSFDEMVIFFKNKGYNNAINLDGNGSSAFLYKNNNGTIQSCPMDNEPKYEHRPIPNFLGFK